MKDDELEEQGFPSLLLEVGRTGLGSFVTTAAFYTVFSDKFTLELVLIMCLAFWIIGLIIEMYLSLEKHNSIIRKYNCKKAKCNELDEKNNALAEQFRSKSYHLDMIRIELPLIYNSVRAISLSQDRSIRMECFECFKEALRKWENEISK